MTTTVQPKHNKTTAKGIAVCEAAGVEFWSLAPKASYWGVRDGLFYLVKHWTRSGELQVTRVDFFGNPIETGKIISPVDLP